MLFVTFLLISFLLYYYTTKVIDKVQRVTPPPKKKKTRGCFTLLVFNMEKYIGMFTGINQIINNFSLVTCKAEKVFKLHWL